VTATYDADGNTLTHAGGRSYTWDFENRLTQAVVPGANGGTTTFKYDPFGRRIQNPRVAHSSRVLVWVGQFQARAMDGAFAMRKSALFEFKQGYSGIICRALEVES